MSKSHKSPGNDSEPFVINQDEVRGDKCSPRFGGHKWLETWANGTRNRVGVSCSKCGTSRMQDHTRDRDPLTGDFPLSA